MAQIKENIKAPRHWPLCGEITGDRWIYPHKWPVTRKKFPFDDVIMISDHDSAAYSPDYTRESMMIPFVSKQIRLLKSSKRSVLVLLSCNDIPPQNANLRRRTSTGKCFGFAYGNWETLSQLYPHTMLQVKASMHRVYHDSCIWISCNFDDFRSLCVSEEL